MKSFGEVMFTEDVQTEQETRGSRAQYASPYRVLSIGEDERAFIETRDAFYFATVDSDGWPYVQHRGGPVGFLKVVGAETLAFADYPGNRQYVSLGNLAAENRVSLFLMDYPRRARLKILATARVVPADKDPDIAAQFEMPKGNAPQSIIKLDIVALDWNCPKYITPRYTEADIEQMLGPKMRAMAARIAELEAELGKGA